MNLRAMLLSLILLLPLVLSAQDATEQPSYEDQLAQRYFQAMLNYNPYDVASTYELACCLGAQGDATRAAQYLGKAIELGFDDLWSVDRSVDFESVRETEEFQAVLLQLTELLAQREREFGELKYFNAETQLPYRLHLPVGYDGTKPVKLVLGLHGFGGNADWFGTLWHAFDDPQFIYAVPQAPYGVPNAGDVGYSWAVLRHADDLIYEQTFALSQDYILSYLSELKQQYNISEVYLLGFSQGGIMAYSLTLDNPDLFSGMACFSSRLEGSGVTPDQIGAESGKLRVLIAHGQQDNAVPIALGESAYHAFEQAGYDVSWLPFDDGHTLPKHALQQFQIWLRGD